MQCIPNNSLVCSDFSLAVRNLVDWLREQVKQRESAAETIEIVLLGHSMGGLVCKSVRGND